MATRQEVYDVINGERVYQDGIWNPSTTSSGGKHTVTEWLVYMQDYLDEAMHHVSRNPDPKATEWALSNIRKIASMCVACMEQNGVVARKLPEDWKR